MSCHLAVDAEGEHVSHVRRNTYPPTGTVHHALPASVSPQNICLHVSGAVHVLVPSLGKCVFVDIPIHGDGLLWTFGTVPPVLSLPFASRNKPTYCVQFMPTCPIPIAATLSRDCFQ